MSRRILSISAMSVGKTLRRCFAVFAFFIIPLCVPKTLSVLIGGENHLTSAHNDRAAMFCPYRLGLAIQVEEPT
jgi:hypothetical protein